MRTIEAYPIPGVNLPGEDYLRCRDHYGRQRGCIDPRNGKVGGKHLGQDIPAKEGTPIVAPCEGEMRYISSSGDYGNWGKFVCANTGKGFWLAHCRDRLKLGTYRKEQVIGLVGTTGTNSTASHGHFELHSDPLNFNSTEPIWQELKEALDEMAESEALRKALLEFIERTDDKYDEMVTYQKQTRDAAQESQRLLKKILDKP